MDWAIFVPITSKTYKIRLFDDGLDKYACYPNRWWVYGDNQRGKVAVVNAYDETVRIGSISEWKMDVLTATEMLLDDDTGGVCGEDTAVNV